MRFPSSLFLTLAFSASLAAQMPPGWNVAPRLGSDEPHGAFWYGAGLWAADRHGPPATLVDSLGMGNALTGQGIHLEAGFARGNWDLAAQLLAVHSPQGADYLSLYRGHATWQNRLDPQWVFSLEMEPLVWGFGLNGGYLLGDAARPFPRFRVESPRADLHVFKVPLGTWSWQAFLGRLENRRAFSDSLQNPLEQKDLATIQGDPQAPLISGYRVQAEFSDFMEFYANYLNLWGGTLNGRGVLDGYSLSEFGTAMFGLKDTLAESNIDVNSGLPQNNAYANRARSSSAADVGFRVRSRPLERALGAESVYGYFSRGSKSLGSSFSLLGSNPGKYIWKDIHAEFQAASQLRLGRIWGQTGRYTSPNLTSPNETIGLLAAWPGFRLGLEYLDAVNAYGPGGPQVRPWNSGMYPSGFYYHGDPLGNATGGEARTTTLRIEADLGRRLTGTTLLHRGERPFRDNLALWMEAHPATAPTPDRFVGLQQSLLWQVRPGVSLAAGASWERHDAVDNTPGARKNGFQYYSDLSFRWPAPAI